MSQAQKMTIRQACEAFGVTGMCLHSWRRGTATKKPLPVSQKAGDRRVYIPVAAARKWARDHGVQFVHDPDVVLGTVTASVKPGNRVSTKAAPATS